MGLDAVAITDHGNMYGALQFYTGCIAAGIKPIVGCEFYMCEDYTKKQGKIDLGHLILIAKNNDGYKNLLKLNSIAFIDGKYLEEQTHKEKPWIIARKGYEPGERCNEIITKESMREYFKEVLNEG